MNQQKFQNGAFAFTRTKSIEPRDPESLQPLAIQHGIDPAFIPAYAGDRTAVGRAITQASIGLSKEGFLLRPIKRTTTDVVYGIVREQKDEAAERLDHDFEATVSWSAEPDADIVRGSHPIAQRVADAYQALRGKIVADDWSNAITTYLENHDAARVRGDGRVYWVPPQRLDAIRRLGTFLQELGIDLILCELEPEVRTVAKDVAHQSLEDQLTRLQEEVDQFDGTQKPSTYTRRLDEYQHLRDRAILYRDALGVGVDRAQSVLTELERKVTAMLELRSQTVIHRNPATATPAEATAPDSSSAATNPDRTALRFGGATFHAISSQEDGTLTFVSDDAAAKASVALLESMGLAGKWQQAGTVQVCIQNSGPLGAAVSIRLRLGQKGDLSTAARPLAAIGIELVS